METLLNNCSYFNDAKDACRLKRLSLQKEAILKTARYSLGRRCRGGHGWLPTNNLLSKYQIFALLTIRSKRFLGFILDFVKRILEFQLKPFLKDSAKVQDKMIHDRDHGDILDWVF